LLLQVAVAEGTVAEDGEVTVAGVVVAEEDGSRVTTDFFTS